MQLNPLLINHKKNLKMFQKYNSSLQTKKNRDFTSLDLSIGSKNLMVFKEPIQQKGRNFTS